jgi:hypothetical protein
LRDEDQVIDFLDATCFQAISMSATVVSLPPSGIAETLDFLRRLASMMSGGRNAEMLLQAASHIETLGRRALSAEQLFHAQQEENAENAALRQMAELAAGRLTLEVDDLKAQHLTDETLRLNALAEDAEARLARANAEIEGLRGALEARSAAMVAVPIHTLRLARAQFNHLAHGFARSGDLISQTICEIGGSAIDQAIAGHEDPAAADADG